MQTFSEYLTEGREAAIEKARDRYKKMNREVADAFAKQPGGKFSDMDAAIDAHDKIASKYGYKNGQMTVDGHRIATKDFAPLDKSIKPKHNYGNQNNE